MAKSLAYLSFIVVISLTFTFTIRPTMAEQECSWFDIAYMTAGCRAFIKFPSNPKIAPSKYCCEVVKKCDMKCVCHYVTKEVEKFICMEKVVYVADQCGSPLPKGIKCGSYEVPPSKKF